MWIRRWNLIFALGLLILSLLLIALFSVPDANLHIIACDVGQGDAILTTYKNIQILTDGGPDNKVEECLGKYLPFWDRDIELIISTHPDADHLTGLIKVLKDYNVEAILINDLNPGTQMYRALENVVGGKGIKVIRPHKGLVLGLGLIHLDILNPLEVVEGGFLDVKNFDTNQTSIIYLLNYGQFRGLFTADASNSLSDDISKNNPGKFVDYIKVPHHGSGNGLTENLLKAFEPKVAVISVGEKNQWGLPNKIILDLLKKYDTIIFRTDENGDIDIATNGVKVWYKSGEAKVQKN